MKLIYYTDSENQLFDLKSDPVELKPIINGQIENELYQLLVNELGETPKVIAEKVKNYNKASFKKWKSEQDKDYVENISNLRWEIDFKADLENNLKKLENWLDEDINDTTATLIMN